jgi:2,4-dienoyl-CoA reductase-like NADH-dependent reductase (Old Yellow Enzyme family)
MDGEKMDQKYRYLLSPGRLGQLAIPNSVVFLPHYTAIENTDCTLQDTAIAYYAERAKGGTGLLIINIQADTPAGKMAEKYIEAWDEKVLSGHRRMSDTAHRYGSKIFTQLSHAGHTTLYHPPQLLLAPIKMSKLCYDYNTKEMEIEDIRERERGSSRRS